MKPRLQFLFALLACSLLPVMAATPFYTDANMLAPRKIRGLLPGHENHQWLEKDIRLSSGRIVYTIKNSACNDPSHAGTSFHYEGYIGMPSPNSCNWYHRGFMYIAVNGQDLGSIPLADFSVLTKTPNALCQMVWKTEDGMISARFLVTPGDDMLRCQVKWTPAPEKSIDSVQLKLVCYPSFFTNKPELGADRILVTPRLSTNHREAKSAVMLQPEEDLFVFYGDAIHDLANGKGNGPCALAFQPEQLREGKVQLGSYGVHTILELQPKNGQANLLFWDFHNKTNAEALQRLREGAGGFQELLAGTVFELEALRDFDGEGLAGQIKTWAARAKEDGEILLPQLLDSLKKLSKLKQQVDAGDQLSSSDFAREYDAFQINLARLKIEAMLNTPE